MTGVNASKLAKLWVWFIVDSSHSPVSALCTLSFILRELKFGLFFVPHIWSAIVRSGESAKAMHSAYFWGDKQDESLSNSVRRARGTGEAKWQGCRAQRLQQQGSGRSPFWFVVVGISISQIVVKSPKIHNISFSTAKQTPGNLKCSTPWPGTSSPPPLRPHSNRDWPENRQMRDCWVRLICMKKN